MNRFSTNSKRIFAGIAAVLLLFVCIVPIVMGVTMRGRMVRSQSFDNRPEFAQQQDGRQFERGAAPATGASEADAAAADAAAQNQNPENRHNMQEGRSGRFDHMHGAQGSQSGRGGFSPIRGVFGFLGGLIRLAGLGLLIAAGILFFRRANGNSDAETPAADPTNAPDMTEQEIRAAMKRLGINKIELE
jgi:hypothetical protein